MLRLYAILSLLLITSIPSFARQRVYGWCEQGGQTVAVPGNLPSTNRVQQSYPSCTVTVYAPGTTTKATIYSDNSGTALSNPFTANNRGFYVFYADDGVFDINLSGSGFTSPYTYGSVQVGPYVDAAGVAHGGTRVSVNGVSVSNSLKRDQNDKVGENISVKDFGATGNGSTDDTVAVQRAFDYAYGNNQQVSVYFPLGSYKVHRIVYRGESFHGDSQNGSKVLGFPGEDVFATTDPSDGTVQAALQYTTIKDIGIYVDSSVNTVGMFPYRLAGENTTANFSWNIGNCALAFPNRDGSKSPGSIGNHMLINRVYVQSYNGPNQANGTCGIFSNIPFNDSTFNEFVDRFTQYGIVNAPGLTVINLFAPDANHFSKLGLYNLVPFIWYGGAHTTMTNIQMYASTAQALGPFIINPPAPNGPYAGIFSPVPAGWEVNGVYTENSSGTTGELMQVDGTSHIFIGGSFKQDAANNSFVQWNANNCKLINVGVGNVSASPAVMVVTGSNNIFEIQTQQGFAAPPITNTGIGNKITIVSSAVNGPSRSQGLNVVHPNPIMSGTGDFLITGNALSPYANIDDLIITTEDFPTAIYSSITADPTVPYSGTYARIAAAGGAFTLNRVDALVNSLTVGQRVPATLATVYICARVPAGNAVQTVFMTDSASTNLGSANLNWTANFGVQSFQVNMTNAVSYVQIGANNNTLTSAEDIAWIAIVPQPTTLTAQQAITGQYFISSSARPTVAPGTSAGTGATASIATGSTIHHGNIAVTVGTSPSTGQAIVLTFPVAFPSPGAFCNINAANGNALAIGFIPNGVPNTTTFNITSAAPLVAGTTYSWNYTCGK